MRETNLNICRNILEELKLLFIRRNVPWRPVDVMVAVRPSSELMSIIVEIGDRWTGYTY